MSKFDTAWYIWDMDTLAHAMWSAALRKKIDEKKPLSKLSFISALFWGGFPDIFAFWPIFIGLVATGGMAGAGSFLGINIRLLYSLSHSIVVAVVVLIVVFLVWRFALKRSFPYAILGWPLHIIFDMPTHAPDRFPTPFLYPVSDFTLPFGIAWSTPWFWVLTWVAIIIFYAYLFFRSRRKQVPFLG